jgi:hypothetical protein
MSRKRTRTVGLLEDVNCKTSMPGIGKALYLTDSDALRAEGDRFQDVACSPDAAVDAATSC